MIHASYSCIASPTLAALYAFILHTPSASFSARQELRAVLYIHNTNSDIRRWATRPQRQGLIEVEIQVVTVGDTTFQAFTLAVRLPRLDKVQLWLASKARG